MDPQGSCQSLDSREDNDSETQHLLPSSPGINNCQDDYKENSPKAKSTTRQKLIFVTFCLSNFGINVFYSLLGPFFPLEAAAKGLDSVTIGLVFGVYELAFVFTSPILGSFITEIGPKFMFVTGIMTCGYCAVLFGFLYLSPPYTTFTVLCFVVRAVEGVGGAGMITASTAILVHAFPDRVATVMGTLEMFSGLGLMIGPPIGGFLYQIGGFRLPFFVSGSVLIVIGVATVFILPKSIEQKPEKQDGTLYNLLSSPLSILTSWLMIVSTACTGYLDISLGPALNHKLGLSPVYTGLVFLIGPAIYAVTAPIVGTLADKIPRHSIWLIIIGYLLAGAGFSFLGPAPFLNIGKLSLWLAIVCQVILGFGLCTMVVGFQLYTMIARAKGMPDTLATYGLVSAVLQSSFSIGCFLGPVAGGALLDRVGFEWTSPIVGIVTAASAGVAIVYIVFSGFCCPIPKFDEEEEDEQDSNDERRPILSD